METQGEWRRCARCLAALPERDTHLLCVRCLGPSHAELALADPYFCICCAALPAATRNYRAMGFERVMDLPPLDPMAAPPVEPVQEQFSPDGSSRPISPSGRPASQEEIHQEMVDFHSRSWEECFEGGASQEVSFYSEDAAEALPPQGEGAAAPLWDVSAGMRSRLQGETLKDEVFQARFTSLLARATAKLGMDWADAPSRAETEAGGPPPPGAGVPARRRMPRCQEVSDVVRSSWDRPNEARSPSQGFLCWSEVEGEPLLGYTAMPPLEQEVAAHLPVGPTGTPRLPSKAGVATAKLADKSYKAAGQTAAMANNLATLLAYQEALLADLRDGDVPGSVLELKRVTDYVLNMVACVARDAGKIMAFSVVTHRLLWLSPTSLSEKDKKVALAAPVSPTGLFGSAGGLAELLQAQHLSAEAAGATRPRGRGRPATRVVVAPEGAATPEGAVGLDPPLPQDETPQPESELPRREEGGLARRRSEAPWTPRAVRGRLRSQQRREDALRARVESPDTPVSRPRSGPRRRI